MVACPDSCSDERALAATEASTRERGETMKEHLYDIVAIKGPRKGERLGPFSEADALRSAEQMNWVAGDHVTDIAISFHNDPETCGCGG
jgi:hypothetical protein